MPRKKIWRNSLAALAVAGIVIVCAQTLPASFKTEETQTVIEIDGTNFGSFDQINGLNSLHKDASGDTFMRVTLRRDFVTDPSLYLWAKNNVGERQGLKDIHLVTVNESGEEVSRQVLKLCQPLNWTVEAANPALGGFHETVALAVQEISTY